MVFIMKLTLHEGRHSSAIIWLCLLFSSICILKSRKISKVYKPPLGGPVGFFFCPRDLGAKQTWRLDTIARLLSEKVLTVSHNNIHRPSAPEKEVNQKENTLGKIAKRRQMMQQILKFTYTQILVKLYSTT